MSKKPMISVLMPVYNAEAFVAESIQSVLNQTFKDFEFLIFDDASTDKSLEIIESFQDSRINVVKNEVNIGMTKNMNKGLDLASGKYIARIDADDICLRNRFQVQVDFLETHPNVGVCGSRAKTIGLSTNFVMNTPLSHELIRCGFLFGNRMIHPTVMMRTHVLRGNNIRYNPDSIVSQDYVLWPRLSDLTEFYNIKTPLIYYRLHGNQTAVKGLNRQSKEAEVVQRMLLKKLGIQVTDEDFEFHRRIDYDETPDKEFVVFVNKWFERIFLSNEATKVYDREALLDTLADRWRIIINRNYVFGKWTYTQMKASFLNQHKRIPFIRDIKFFLRCIRNISKLRKD